MTTSNKVLVKDLPLYKQSDDKVYVEDSPLLLESYVGEARSALEPTYQTIRNGVSSLGETGAVVVDGAKKLQSYFTDENQSAIPKAIAITLGGMGGFLIGMRRGGLIRRVTYSGLGMTMLAAFCYPNQTMDIGRTAVKNVQRQWDEFVAPPTPTKEGK